MNEEFKTGRYPAESIRLSIGTEHIDDIIADLGSSFSLK